MKLNLWMELRLICFSLCILAARVDRIVRHCALDTRFPHHADHGLGLRDDAEADRVGGDDGPSVSPNMKKYLVKKQLRTY